jgi:hypothetical protein
MLNAEMKALITAYPLGFVATVSDDGTPNLSPKGTFVIIDDRHLCFGNIRSPKTVKNLKRRPDTEVNFIDILARQAVRVKAHAEIVERNTPQFDDLITRFSHWHEYTPLVKSVVLLTVLQASLVLSPAYDIGHTKEELTAQYRMRYAGG